MSFAQKVREELLEANFKCKNCNKSREMAIDIFCQTIPPKSFISKLSGNECCVSAFILGAFLACGSITDPNLDYHLEFKSKDLLTSNELRALLEQAGFNFKASHRHNDSIIYVKDSEQIEDVLTYMGATKSALEIMDIKILKELKNNLNRTTNCDVANFSKTVNASAVHINAINTIISKRGFNFIPDELKELAKLRIDNPEITLDELRDLLQENLSKSGVNYRLKKLIRLSNSLK